MATVTDPVGTSTETPTSQNADTRIIRPRRTWPGSRAAVGGLLVAIAAIGLFGAFQQANAEPETLYIVTRTDIAPGTVLTASHLGAQRMDLPAELQSRTFSTAEQADLLGSITTQAIGQGELVQLSDVRAGAGQDLAVPLELSFRISADRAVDGTLRAGERVNIIATFGSGQAAPTNLVLPDVLILGVSRSDEPGLAGRQQVITIALDDPAASLSIVAAADKGTLTLVRSNRG